MFLYIFNLLFCCCSKNLDGEIIKKTKWSGEGETSELSLCFEYRNSTWTLWELKTKEFLTIVL